MGRKKTALSMGIIFNLLFIVGCAGQDSDPAANTGADTVFPAQEAAVTQAPATNVTQIPAANAAEITAAGVAQPPAEGTTAVEPTALPPDVTLLQPDTDYVTEDMYKNAMLNEGNLARIAAVMKKARNGDEITVAVIGGSITQGSLASGPDNSYASRFYQWWVRTFPDTKVNFINAGIGGTTSYLGVHRVDKDLLFGKPDVVVVEFSVNDSNSLFYKETYEDLVRRILKQENMPAVIQLMMTMEDGTSAQMQHLLVGFKYNLPRISYGNMVIKAMTDNTLTWDEISPDNIHPNDRGHAMLGEILWKYLNGVYAKLDTVTEQPAPLEVEPYFTEAYIDATILDNTGIEPVFYGSFEKASVNNIFGNDWTTASGSDGIIFETETQNIGIMFLRTVDGKSGQFDVYIDGVFARKLDANFKSGWGNYQETVEVYRSGEKKMHTIEIRKADDSTGDVFSILGLLIS
jgi:lysophospholipase L1-like esterase